jgi:hypothetical protein
MREIHLLPQLQFIVIKLRYLGQSGLFQRSKEWVDVLLSVKTDLGPYRGCFVNQRVSFSLTVCEEGAELAGIKTVCQILEKVLGELKLARELQEQLEDTVKELDEDWTSLVVPVFLIKVAKPPLEHVAKREPIFLNEYCETIDSPEIRV